MQLTEAVPEGQKEHPPMLNSLVTDKRLAWEAKDIVPEQFTVDLSGAALRELDTQRAALQLSTSEFTAKELDTSVFPLLTLEVRRLQREHLDEGTGMLVIRRSSLKEFTKLEERNINWAISHIIGEPITQNEKGDRYVAVKDMGKRMTQGGRYHQSNEGGELHTDSPQYPKPPAYVGLHCIHPAVKGGDSRMISAYAVHNTLMREQPDVLPTLYKPFHFARPGTEPLDVTVAPVFTYGTDGLTMRYLGQYIRLWHEKSGPPLLPKQAAALAAVDAQLQNKDLVAEFSLAEGDMFYFNNKRTIHGRTGFQDDPEGKAPPREMGRIWIAPRA